METKFLHEHRNRQDKARKCDYREAFYAESAFKDSPRHLESFRRMLEIGKLRLEIESDERDQILAYKQALALCYWHGTYRLGGHNFRLRWSFKEYLQNNQIEANRSQTHKRHSIAAKRDAEAIIGAICEALVTLKSSREGRQQIEIILSVGIECDSVTPDQPSDDDILAPVLTKPVLKRPQYLVT